MESLEVGAKFQGLFDGQKILVTGSTGFIGSHLIRALLDLSSSVQITVLLRANSDLRRIRSELPRLRVAHSLEEAFDQEFDAVVHLSTHYMKDDSEANFQTMRSVNVELAKKLFEHTVESRTKRFITTGTFFEFSVQSQPITEESPKNPYNFYAKTKIEFSRFLQEWALEHEKEASALAIIDLKLFAPYGPDDNPKLFDFLVKNFLQGIAFEMSPGEQLWSWTYISDIVNAILLSLITPLAGYNDFVIGAEPGTIRDIIGYLEEVSGRKSLVSFTLPYRNNEIMVATCDCKKAKDVLGWVPSVSLREGTHQVFKSYVQN